MTTPLLPASASRPAPAFKPWYMREGDGIGQYTVCTSIGEGSSSIVYDVKDRAGAHFALKLSRHPLASNGFEWQASARHYQSVMAHIALRGVPHVVKLVGHGLHQTSDGDYPYLVMEMVPGGETITRWAKRTSPTMVKLVDVFTKIGKTLGELARMNICHRDLKPANILVNADGVPMIVDLNSVSFPTSNSVTYPAASAVPVTLAYLSPELAGAIRAELRTGVKSRYDYRPTDDMYAVGCVLYEVLTGEHPHDIHETPEGLLESIATREPTAPHLLNRTWGESPAVPRAISKVTMKLLALNPDDRYQDGDELAEALKDAYRNSDVSWLKPFVIPSEANPALPHFLCKETPIVPVDLAPERKLLKDPGPGRILFLPGAKPELPAGRVDSPAPNAPAALAPGSSAGASAAPGPAPDPAAARPAELDGPSAAAEPTATEGETGPGAPDQVAEEQIAPAGPGTAGGPPTEALTVPAAAPGSSPGPSGEPQAAAPAPAALPAPGAPGVPTAPDGSSLAAGADDSQVAAPAPEVAPPLAGAPSEADSSAAPPVAGAAAEWQPVAEPDGSPAAEAQPPPTERRGWAVWLAVPVAVIVIAGLVAWLYLGQHCPTDLSAEKGAAVLCKAKLAVVAATSTALSCVGLMSVRAADKDFFHSCPAEARETVKLLGISNHGTASLVEGPNVRTLKGGFELRPGRVEAISHNVGWLGGGTLLGEIRTDSNGASIRFTKLMLHADSKFQDGLSPDTIERADRTLRLLREKGIGYELPVCAVVFEPDLPGFRKMPNDEIYRVPPTELHPGEGFIYVEGGLLDLDFASDRPPEERWPQSGPGPIKREW